MTKKRIQQEQQNQTKSKAELNSREIPGIPFHIGTKQIVYRNMQRKICEC